MDKQILEEEYLVTKKQIQSELEKIKQALAGIQESKKSIDLLGEKLAKLQKDYEELKG